MSATVWGKFYWGDWLSDAGLRRSGFAARGLWIDMLCIAAQADPIGYLTVKKVPLSVNDIARMVGGSEPEVRTLLEELERNGVLSRDRNGTIFSRRVVRDAKKSREAKKNGKLGGNPTLSNDNGKSGEVNLPDNGEVKPQKPETTFLEERKKDAAVAALETDEVQFFRRGKQLLGPSAGGMLRNLLGAKNGNVPLARAALETASTKENPREYLGAIIRGREQPANEHRLAGRSW